MSLARERESVVSVSITIEKWESFLPVFSLLMWRRAMTEAFLDSSVFIKNKQFLDFNSTLFNNKN